MSAIPWYEKFFHIQGLRCEKLGEDLADLGRRLEQFGEELNQAHALFVDYYRQLARDAADQTRLYCESTVKTPLASSIGNNIATMGGVVGQTMVGMGGDFEETGTALMALATGPMGVLQFALGTFVSHVAEVDGAMDSMTGVTRVRELRANGKPTKEQQ